MSLPSTSVYRLPKNTNFTKLQEQWYQMLLDLDPNEFTLFHLTTTYLPFQDRIYQEKDLTKFFTNFHLKTLLPELFHSRTWTRTKKLQQPIVLSFLDEHDHKAVQMKSNASNSPIYSFPIRLHHHSIIASRTCTTDFYRSRIGENTLLSYSAKFMTTDLKECDADRVFYASKMIKTYPDCLIFGFQ